MNEVNGNKIANVRSKSWIFNLRCWLIKKLAGDMAVLMNVQVNQMRFEGEEFIQSGREYKDFFLLDSHFYNCCIRHKDYRP